MPREPLPFVDVDLVSTFRGDELTKQPADRQPVELVFAQADSASGEEELSPVPRDDLSS